ncbi:4-hydroxy-tetrahydrodipicolinate reductase [Candidatus Neptunichlamydia sp. REUL1]|uniref:4-hydroxy-tetrahydrodipicolinate reductase n=1 Tax=Candidatus Neptunichlamydia sp. REUL1 TaxID=3064277 RepID=UPI0029312CD4|nr:dihydrodipicolinate reductase C-terminal domain-containing protein [Candidatus Neptunochlamydia sp. REUL1]
MKIALVGYGKMGKAVRELSLLAGHSCSSEIVSDADVCIDFSVGGAVKKTALSIEIPWVLGTTGWSKDEILPIVKKRKIPFLYAPNFSIGMALFRKMAKLGESLFKGYEIEGVETHHVEKKDAPSGTALRLMEEIEGLKFTSIRRGEEVGTHQIMFHSQGESVELTHRAHDRKVFARGAILSAEWLVGKKGVYTFDDYIEERASCHLQELQQH